MSDTFLLYLLTRLDAIKDVITFLLVVGGTVYAAALLWFAISYVENFGDEEVQGLKIYLFWSLIPLIAFAFLQVAIPSKKDAMFIVGGSAVLEAAKSDTAQRVASKSVQMVEKYLDEQLKGEK